MGDYDRAIQDFDQAIRINPNFTVAFNNRGEAYRIDGDYDRAIRDFDQAIRLNPNYAFAFNNRGMAFRDKSDFHRAIQEFDQAIRLDPDCAGLFYNRGVARYAIGQYSTAQKDFLAALQLQPKQLYYALFVYLVQARAGNNSLTDLRNSVAGLDLTKWPGQIVDFYTGNLSAEAVLSTAKDPNPKKEQNQLCEVYFFFAESALLRGDPTRATAFLGQALQTGAIRNAEFSVAKEELRRLGTSRKPKPK